MKTRTSTAHIHATFHYSQEEMNVMVQFYRKRNEPFEHNRHAEETEVKKQNLTEQNGYKL